jgi:hypothetical protein
MENYNDEDCEVDETKFLSSYYSDESDEDFYEDLEDDIDCSPSEKERLSDIIFSYYSDENNSF